MNKDTNFYTKTKGYVYRKTTLGLTSLSIVFPIGSGYETVGKRGISHLMEHLITKPIDKFNTFFTENCIDYNACTTRNYVIVYFRGLEERLNPEIKQKLIDATLHGFDYVTKSMFEVEKKIVLQELGDAYADPFSGNLINILYSRFRVHDPTGFVRDIKQFTYEDAKKMARDFFTKPIRIVDIANQKTEYKNVEYVKQVFKPKKIKYRVFNREILPVQEFDKSCVYLIGKKPVNKLDYIYVTMGMEMLASGLESPLFQEFREKTGLCYDINYDVDYVTHNSILWVGMITDKENVAEVTSRLSSAAKNIRKFLSPERFNSIKNQFTIYNEIKHILRYSKNTALLEAEIPEFSNRLDSITYEKLCDIMESAFYDVEIVVK